MYNEYVTCKPRLRRTQNQAFTRCISTCSRSSSEIFGRWFFFGLNISLFLCLQCYRSLTVIVGTVLSDSSTNLKVYLNANLTQLPVPMLCPDIKEQRSRITLSLLLPEVMSSYRTNLNFSARMGSDSTDLTADSASEYLAQNVPTSVKFVPSHS